MTTPYSRINLGDKVRDRVTGFEGIVTAYVGFLGGTQRYEVQPALLADGRYNKSMLFDPVMLEVLQKSAIAPAVDIATSSDIGSLASSR